MANEELNKDQRILNAKAWYVKHGIDRDTWLARTGFSEDQWNRWHSLPQGSSPTIDQIVGMFTILDMNPLFLWYGIGPETISEVRGDYEGTFHSFQELKAQIDEIYDVVKSGEIKSRVDAIHTTVMNIEAALKQRP